MRIFDFIARLFGKSKTAEKPVSPEMQTALETWLTMYRHQDSTPNNNNSLDLPAAISSEFARLVMAESDIHVSTSYLDKQFQKFLKRFLIKADEKTARRRLSENARHDAEPCRHDSGSDRTAVHFRL